MHSTYSVCKVNCVSPEVTFKRIIEQYKQLAGAGACGALSGSVGTPRLSVIKDILLSDGGSGDSNAVKEGDGDKAEPREPERGDIIKFYNKASKPLLRAAVSFARLFLTYPRLR